MKILKDADYKRLCEQADVARRIYDARYWFSEFDFIFLPMWDFIFGKTESQTGEYGRCEMFSYGSVSNSREAVRGAMEKFKSENEVKAIELLERVLPYLTHVKTGFDLPQSAKDKTGELQKLISDIVHKPK